MKLRGRLLGGAALLLCLCATASAGPFEDGKTALEKKDYDVAARAFGEAAAKGDTRAQGMMGVLYEFGLGVPQDYKQAMQWFGLAAQAGDAGAETNLGDMYAYGRGVTQDWGQAAKYYAMAAKKGHPGAQERIGEMYLHGAGPNLPKDYGKALQWFELAAKQGNANAEFELGYMSFYGVGTDKNFPLAVSFLTPAAQQENVSAEALLGYAYDNGYGVPQDYAEAIRYYTLAARQGNTTAQALLGEKYSSGQGVTQDWEKAYMLLSLAASRMAGQEQQAILKERDAAQAKLTKAEIDRAQAGANACASSGFQECNIGEPGDASGPPTQIADAGGPHKLKPVSSGSGFFVSRDGHVITNAHVVKGCTEMRSPGLASLKVMIMDEQSDLALLQTDKKPASFAKIRGGRGDRLGESVVALGFPLLGILGSNPIVTSGVISSLSGLGNDRRLIQISAPIQPGNSGGPVIGEDGALVGVVESKISESFVADITGGQLPQNVNFAVSLGTLQSFLNANRVPYVLTDGGPKKSASEISEAASGYTLVLECWK